MFFRISSKRPTSVPPAVEFSFKKRDMLCSFHRKFSGKIFAKVIFWVPMGLRGFFAEPSVAKKHPPATGTRTSCTSAILHLWLTGCRVYISHNISESSCLLEEPHAGSMVVVTSTTKKRFWMLGPIKHLDCNSSKLTNTKSQTNSIQSTLILLFGQTPAPVDIVDIPSFTVCDYIWIILNWLTGFDPSTMHSPLDDFFVPCGSASLPPPPFNSFNNAAPASCGAGTSSGSIFFNPHEPRQLQEN